MPAMSKVHSIKRNAATGHQSALVKALGDYASQQIKDPFEELYGLAAAKGGDAHLNVLAPPYPPDALVRVPIQNNVLLQCVAAMVTNCDLFGHTLVYVGTEEQKEAPAVLEEKKRLEALLSMPDGQNSFRKLRKLLRTDLEFLGYNFIEVGRGEDGEIAWFTHIPGTTMRLCPLDPEFVTVTRKVKRGDNWIEIKVEEQFRRYVQIAGTRKRYFKQFGDPRVIDAKTGKTLGSGVSIPEEQEATEVIHHGFYTPGDVYGKPRWVNNILSALGSRESELVNLQFFRDNAIPALAILVSGGELTVESLAAINDMFAAGGKEMVHRALVLEAKGNPDDAGGVDSPTPVPTLSLQPLVSDRQTDALFAAYDEANQQKLRSSYRIPPIFIGRSEDYTRATAEASLQMGENQVFGPERQDFDDMMMTKLLSYDGRPPEFWQFRSNAAKLSDPEGIMAALNTLNSLGAVTTNQGIQIFNELFSRDVPKIEDDWADLPFALVSRMLDAKTLQLSQEAQSAVDKLAKFILGTESTAANAVTNGTVRANQEFGPKRKAKVPVKPAAKATTRIRR